MKLNIEIYGGIAIKKVIYILVVSSILAGCSLVLPFDCGSPYAEKTEESIDLISGTWSGNLIITDIGNFNTIDNVVGAPIAILIYESENNWYIWCNGYGMQIELIETK